LLIFLQLSVFTSYFFKPAFPVFHGIHIALLLKIPLSAADIYILAGGKTAGQGRHRFFLAGQECTREKDGRIFVFTVRDGARQHQPVE